MFLTVFLCVSCFSDEVLPSSLSSQASAFSDLCPEDLPAMLQRVPAASLLESTPESGGTPEPRCSLEPCKRCLHGHAMVIAMSASVALAWWSWMWLAMTILGPAGCCTSYGQCVHSPHRLNAFATIGTAVGRGIAAACHV